MSRFHPSSVVPGHGRTWHAGLAGVLATSLVSLAAAVAIPATADAATTRLATASRPATSARSAAAAATTDTATFTCTGYPQQWAVPDDVTSISFDAIGGMGGMENENNNNGAPGNGAEVEGTVPVTPGSLLTITVGCAGGPYAGGYGYTDGGIPGGGQGGQIGTGGGGSSGVTLDGAGQPLVVAGGGGGGGGQAGGLVSQTYGGGGGNGSQQGDPGGTGGGCGGADAPGGGGGITSNGVGQAGEDDQSVGQGGGTGGGGGGGYHGGGGGGAGDFYCSAGGGGGGSSTLASSATATSYGNSANPGQVAITYSSSLPDNTPRYFTCTAAATTYQVPSDVNELDVIAVGGVGGGSETQVGEGESQGAGEHHTVAVTPGQKLTVGAGCVGGRGESESEAGGGGQVPGGYGLASGGIGGSGTVSGSGGGGSSGLATPAGTVLIEAAGGGGGCNVSNSAAPYTGGGGSCAPASGQEGASGAPGNDPQGEDGGDSANEQGGSGGGGSTYGPGGGGGASTSGSPDTAGSGGGGLSYPGDENISGGWGTGNVDPTSWYDQGEPSNNGITFSNGTAGLVAVSPAGYVAPTADLAVTVVAEQSTPTLGTLDTYDVTLTDNGPDGATGITVANDLPAGLQLTGYSAPTGTSYDYSSSNWTVPEIDAGQSLLLELTVEVSGYGTYRETAEVTSTGPSADPIPGNNFAQGTFVTAAADLAVTASVATSQADTGQNVDTYTITATNNGPSGADGTAVANTLPSGFVYQSSSAPAGTTVTGNSASTQQQWSIGPLGAGQTETLTIVADDPSNSGGTDTAVISDTSPSDPDTSNNTATATVTDADLAITNSVSTTYDGPGQTVDTYTVTATNNGPDAASGVTVTNTLPESYVYQSSSVTTGSASGSSGSAQQLWDIGTLPTGDVETLTVVAGDPQDVGGTDSAAILSSSADPDQSNNSASATTSADTQVGTTTVADAPHATVGETVSFTTDVFNNGPANLTSGTVTVYLPSDLAFVSSDSAGVYDSYNNSYNFHVTDVEAYHQANETLQATVLEPSDPTVSADRSATVSSVLIDASPPNNTPGDATSSATTIIDPSTLSVTPSSTVRPGVKVSYTAIGADPDGVSDGNVTAGSIFTIVPAAGSTGAAKGASCTAHACHAETPGVYTVSATDGDTGGTATLTVSGPWARPASAGLPNLAKMSPDAFAIGVDYEHWELEATQPVNKPGPVFAGTITINHGSFSAVKGIKLETNDHYSVSGGQITFSFLDAAEIDGLSWTTPSAATTITFDLTVSGQPASAAQIKLGPTGTLSTTGSPTTIDRVGG